ncbi:diguanylate cyclase domain-containing protein [Dactylosporangium salmoneum]|uniref:GGDEF domain-containing protein n=1 Tax=Dactylosporangium salmoneum TaxID=53361 RepID=A0ABN3H8S2_9ACTN
MFLLFGVFNLVMVFPRLIVGHEASPETRAGAGAAGAALLAWWLVRYRQGSFPVWAAPLEAVALALVGIGAHDWVETLGLTFAFVAFRGLYGTWRHGLVYTVIIFAAALGAVALTEPVHIPAMLKQAPGVPMLAIFTAVVAEATARQERAAARERVFARLGASLATTTDAAVVAQHTAEAAVRLLTGLPGAWAATIRARPDGEEVAAVDGPAPGTLFASGGPAPGALPTGGPAHGTLPTGGPAHGTLLGLDAPDDAPLVAERMLAAIRAPVHACGVELTASVSIGLATWRNHAEIDQLLHDADAAMYAAKQAGKNRIATMADGVVKLLSPVGA